MPPKTLMTPEQVAESVAARVQVINGEERPISNVEYAFIKANNDLRYKSGRIR